MYQQVLPSGIVLPNTGANDVLASAGTITLLVATVVVATTLARYIAKKAYKA